MAPLILFTLLGAGAALFAKLGRSAESDREELAQVRAWSLKFGNVTPLIEHEITSLLGQLGEVREFNKPGSSVISLVWYPDLRQANRWEFPAKRWPSHLISQVPHV